MRNDDFREFRFWKILLQFDQNFLTGEKIAKMLWMEEEADDFLEEADNSGLPVTQPLGIIILRYEFYL